MLARCPATAGRRAIAPVASGRIGVPNLPRRYADPHHRWARALALTASRLAVRPNAVPSPPVLAAPSTSPGSTVTGWLESIALVVAIGALSVAYAIGHAWGAHPIAFILYAMVASAGATLAFTGLGPDPRAIILHPKSWIVGLAIILTEIFYYLTLTYVPPAHGNLMMRISIPIAMLAGWGLLGRRPPALALGAALLIVIATLFVIAFSPPDVRWPMAAAGFLGSTFMAVRGFVSEFHPWNRVARTVREKLRVTGIFVLITSLMSLVLTATAAVMLPENRFIPTVAQMLHVPTLLLGALLGGAILTTMMYLNFSSVVKITTENVTAMMAFAPLAAWAFQEVAVALGLIVAERPAPRLVAAMLVFVTAVLMIFWAGRKRRLRIEARASG